MPEAMERALKSQAHKKGLTGKALAKYVYGTMRKSGWKPSTQKGHASVQALKRR